MSKIIKRLMAFWKQHSLFFRNFALVFFPCLAAFLAPSEVLKYLLPSNLVFPLKHAPDVVFASNWIIFLCAFCLFHYALVVLLIGTHYVRAKLLSRWQMAFVLSVELVLTVFIYRSIEHRGVTAVAGMEILGEHTLQWALAAYFNMAMATTFDVIFRYFHAIFTVTAAIAAVTCVNNFWICLTFRAEGGEVGVPEIEIHRRLYRRNFYFSLAVWTLGIIQLVAWLRLPVGSIQDDRLKVFLTYISSVIFFYSVTFTLVLVTAYVTTYFIFKRYLDRLRSGYNDTKITENYMLSYFAIPVLTGFLANIFSNIFS